MELRVNTKYVLGLPLALQIGLVHGKNTVRSEIGFWGSLFGGLGKKIQVGKNGPGKFTKYQVLGWGRIFNFLSKALPLSMLLHSYTCTGERGWRPGGAEDRGQGGVWFPGLPGLQEGLGAGPARPGGQGGGARLGRALAQEEAAGRLPQQGPAGLLHQGLESPGQVHFAVANSRTDLTGFAF